MNIHLKNKDINISKTYLVLGIILILSIILIIIKACTPNNKLVCTYTSQNVTGDFKTIYTANFKNSKLETLIIEYENKPTKDYLDMIDDIYINYENKLKQLEAGGGYEYKLKKESNKVYFTSKINLNKIPDTTKEEVGFNNEWTYKSFKKYLETKEFKCK